MATLIIEPIEIETTGGIKGKITGICPTSSDCIKGVLEMPHVPDVYWDINGTCRDNHPNCNLNTSAIELSDLIETVKAVVPEVYLT